MQVAQLGASNHHMDGPLGPFRSRRAIGRKMATVDVTDKNFREVTEREGIVILDFWATWCGACKAFAPVYEAASESHMDILFGKVDTEAAQQLSAMLPGLIDMHVHIDSRAFTPASLARLLAFYNRKANTALICKVAGRHPETSIQCRSYANYDSADGTFTELRRAKRDMNACRYVMVNTTTLSYLEGTRLQLANSQSHNTRGFSTVEIRVFRASLRKARLLAQIEFAHAVVIFCRHTGAGQLDEPHFRAWLATEYSQYPALARFLGIDVPRRAPTPLAAARADELVTELVVA